MMKLIRFLFEFTKSQLAVRPKFILFTLLAFLCLNAFWVVASQWMFVFRPHINYDYGLALMAAPISAILCALALIVVFFMELFISNALIFHFDGAFSFFQSAEFARELRLQDFINWNDGLIFAGFVLVAVICARLMKGRTNAMAALIVIVMFFAADQLNGSSDMFKSDDQLIEGNLGGSSVLQIYASFKEEKTKPKLASLIAPEDLPLPPSKMMRWADANPDKSVLFIIVESMGLNANEDVNAWLLSRLVQGNLDDAYDVEFGSARFHGATTASEMRHLCGIKGKYSSILNDALTQQCLPKIFAEKGYKVSGSHGFSANMFLRSDWWPKLGFEETLFARFYHKQNAPSCGSGLYGICDEYITQSIADQIREEKGFYYQLTLNTHLPLLTIDVPVDLQALCDASDMSDDACMLNAKIGEYFTDVSNVLNALDNKPYVFLVGDHAPPFTGKTSRDSFSKTHTPYFILQPQ